MKAANWIDRVKAEKGIESDYRAAKELGCKPHTISMYRSNETLMDEAISLKVAEALAIDPIIILADQALERAKSEAARKAWAGVLGNFASKKKAPSLAAKGLAIAGGNGGIRTLDEALHPILP